METATINNKQYTLDRQAIRKALTEFREVESQLDAILVDDEVQALYRQERVEEARQLISTRYPLGNRKLLEERGVKLIQEMTRGMPDWEDIEPLEIYLNVTYFNRLLNLAERV